MRGMKVARPGSGLVFKAVFPDLIGGGVPPEYFPIYPFVRKSFFSKSQKVHVWQPRLVYVNRRSFSPVRENSPYVGSGESSALHFWIFSGVLMWKIWVKSAIRDFNIRHWRRGGRLAKYSFYLHFRLSIFKKWSRGIGLRLVVKWCARISMGFASICTKLCFLWVEKLSPFDFKLRQNQWFIPKSLQHPSGHSRVDFLPGKIILHQNRLRIEV